MKIGIVVYSNDSETVWNALRFGNFTLAMGDEVRLFLLGKGVETESLDTDKFSVTGQMQIFINDGGKIFACGTCLDMRQMEAPKAFIISTLNDLYEIVKESDRVITF